MKASEFIQKLKDVEANHKTLYVMGCFGAPLTGGNVSRYCSNHDYNKAAARTKMIKAAANQTPPVFGFDCVNLIKGILWGWTGDPARTYGGAQYGTNGVPDIGADGMIKKCLQVSTTGWASMLPGRRSGVPATSASTSAAALPSNAAPAGPTASRLQRSAISGPNPATTPGNGPNTENCPISPMTCRRTRPPPPRPRHPAASPPPHLPPHSR